MDTACSVRRFVCEGNLAEMNFLKETGPIHVVGPHFGHGVSFRRTSWKVRKQCRHVFNKRKPLGGIWAGMRNNTLPRPHQRVFFLLCRSSRLLNSFRYYPYSLVLSTKKCVVIQPRSRTLFFRRRLLLLSPAPLPFFSTRRRWLVRGSRPGCRTCGRLEFAERM